MGCGGGPTPQGAPTYSTNAERVPEFPREFRATWSACIYNIDWPSRKGLSSSSQKAELIGLLNMMQDLNMNAVFFQVRPHADAVYSSRKEPWSPWLSGRMGVSPGYDPLRFCVKEAHKRGIEVHAWFNPFRALANASMPVPSSHITKRKPYLVKRFKNYKWMDISKSESRQIATDVIMDVVKRYDIDGVHLDDYFYPYPTVNKQGVAIEQFPDGKSPSQRRGYVNSFVKSLYSTVKTQKPWVRVGISPFGIWRPGVPSTIEANISAYDHLGADSRKWLKSGWVDYLSPQLYWRDQPAKQSFSTLLNWWRRQGSRPVWPGIATSRINSSDDPGRPSSEIIKQVDLSRSIGRNYSGHAHWSIKSLRQNRGGIRSKLKSSRYTSPALVPPMPWISTAAPAPPTVRRAGGSQIQYQSNGKRVTVQAYLNGVWYPLDIKFQSSGKVSLPANAQRVALRSVDRYGNTSSPAVINFQ